MSRLHQRKLYSASSSWPQFGHIDAYRGPHGTDSGHQIEFPTMTGTDQTIALHISVGQQSAIVGTAIGQGKRASVLERDNAESASTATRRSDLPRFCPGQGLAQRGTFGPFIDGITADQVAGQRVKTGFDHGGHASTAV